MSFKLRIITAWINYVSNLINWISNANCITKRALSVEIRNCVDC
jgi:hypothetical protein